jgi:hypothetical protein
MWSSACRRSNGGRPRQLSEEELMKQYNTICHNISQQTDFALQSFMPCAIELQQSSTKQLLTSTTTPQGPDDEQLCRHMWSLIDLLYDWLYRSRRRRRLEHLQSVRELASGAQRHLHAIRRLSMPTDFMSHRYTPTSRTRLLLAVRDLCGGFDATLEFVRSDTATVLSYMQQRRPPRRAAVPTTATGTGTAGPPAALIRDPIRIRSCCGRNSARAKCAALIR